MRIAEARVSRLGVALFMTVVASFPAVGAGGPGVWKSGGPYGACSWRAHRSSPSFSIDATAPTPLKYA